MLPGIGPKTLIKLEKLGINTPQDLLYHFPHRYLDFSRQLPIGSLTPEIQTTIRGKIQKFQNIFSRSGKNLQIVTLADESGQIDLVFFNQPYLSTIFRLNLEFNFAGKVSFYQNRLTIFSPEYGQYHTGQIVPVYPETKGLTSKWFRKTIQNNLNQLLKLVSDPIPDQILKNSRLTTLDTALRQIHQPKNLASLQLARTRLATDEILGVLAKSHLLRQKQSLSPPNPLSSFPVSKITDSLPFKLTPSQKKAWAEIKKDLTSKTKLTNRLIIGDVGSGKTVLAILAAYLTFQNRQNTLLLAPTNILATQHYQNFKKYLTKVPTKLLTSKSKIKRFPQNSIIIATHAAIHHRRLPPISLLIVDEQHKFGVLQRNFLGKQFPPPHQITISATPIPRTIGLTIFGHLDISRIADLPGHQPVKTFLIPSAKINDCYLWLKKQIKTTKTQAFIVCPFIEESETNQSVKSAVKEFDYLSKEIFPDLKLDLIHGKIKNKDQILEKFVDNKINILVTTPIIEVGIDIHNATTIIIQSPERFGLSQLHQLRGRIGRAGNGGFCYLLANNNPRLEFFAKTTDGQKIAEYDFRHRGPGEIFATIQHGFPRFKLASLNQPQLISFGQKVLNLILDQFPQFDLNKLSSGLLESAIIAP